jgi:hypothetical protein
MHGERERRRKEKDVREAGMQSLRYTVLGGRKEKAIFEIIPRHLSTCSFDPKCRI